MRLTTLLTILLIAGNAVASDGTEQFVEGLNATMKRFYNGCVALADGVAGSNEILVERPESPDHITTSRLKALPVDTASLANEQSKFRFSADFALQWIDTNGKGPFVESPPLSRAVSSECKLLELCLKPNSKAVYKVRLQGRCDIFAVTSPGTQISLKIESAGETVDVRNNGALSYASWRMERRGFVLITIENISDIPASVVLASN